MSIVNSAFETRTVNNEEVGKTVGFRAQVVACVGSLAISAEERKTLLQTLASTQGFYSTIAPAEKNVQETNGTSSIDMSSYTFSLILLSKAAV